MLYEYLEDPNYQWALQARWKLNQEHYILNQKIKVIIVELKKKLNIY